MQREIPKVLEGFINRDKFGEYLRLQDPNGNFVKIRVEGSSFTVVNEVNETPPLGLTSSKPPEVFFDARVFGNGVNDLEYTLRRRPVPGELFVFWNNLTNIYCIVINEKNFITLSFSDITVVGSPDTTTVSPVEETETITVLFTSTRPDGTSVQYLVDPAFKPAWLLTTEGVVTIDSGAFNIVLNIDYAAWLAVHNDGATIDELTFLIKFWDIADPEIIINANIFADLTE